ncbi:MAG: hypothetical protein LBT80_00340 [Lactobacillaceae bacterium]|jgi:hypothetical protein|nr:hypothetical protein [Lactobacillaceae bacterium]
MESNQQAKLNIIDNAINATNDLVRLSMRQRKVRLQRRLIIGRMRRQMLVVNAFLLVIDAIIISLLLLPRLSLETELGLLTLTVGGFGLIVIHISQIAHASNDKLLTINVVNKQVMRHDELLLQIEMEITTVINTDVFAPLPIDESLIDLRLLRKAREFILEQPNLEWRDLNTWLKILHDNHRMRRQSVYMVEKYRRKSVVLPTALKRGKPDVNALRQTAFPMRMDGTLTPFH